MSDIDPTRSIDPRVRRGTFVGLAAGAAGAATMGGALAQTLGQPHPPLVPENDPDIAVKNVQLRRPDGTVLAYAAIPRAAKPNAPGVVVVMHIWGIDRSIRDVVRRYAKAGFVAIAPDLYARFNAPSGDGSTDYTQFRPFAKQLQTAQVDGDIRAAGLWIKSAYPASRVGVTGFCMGGAIALRQAIANDDVFSADAVFYGNPEGIDPAKIHMPMEGNYGQRDTSIPADSVRAFFKALRAPNDLVIYPTAGHAFFDDQRSSYVPAAAEDAWKRTLAFFTKYLNA